MAEIKQNPIIDAIAQQAQAQADTELNTVKLLEQMKTFQDATAEKIQGIKDSVDASVAVSNEQEYLKSKLDANNAAALAYLGGSPSEASSRLARYAAERAEAFDKAMAIKDEIDRKKQDTFFTNPLGWIQNQFTLPAEAAAYSHYAERHNAMEAEYISTVNAMTATGQANKAMEATTSVALAQAKAAQIMAQGKEQMAAASMMGAQFNSQGILHLQSLSQDALKTANTLVDIDMKQKDFELRKENMALTRAQRQLTTETLLEKQKSREEQDAAETYIAAMVNVGAAHLGKPELDKRSILMTLRAKGQRADDFNRYLRIGEDISNNPDGGISGISIGTAAETAGIYKRGGATPVGVDRGTVEYLVDSYNKALTDPQIAAQKDPQVRESLINKKINDEAVKQLRSIKDSSNIYAAPTPVALLKAVPQLADLPFIKSEILPLAEANPAAPVSDATILSTAVQKMKENPKNFETIAAQLDKYYAGVLRANNTLKLYQEKGLPVQKEYQAVVPYGVFGNNITVNIANPIELRKLLMLQSRAYAATPDGILTGALVPTYK